METPAHKLVHWNTGSPECSPFGSPNFSEASNESFCSTSSLQYLNSQLVAHGFAPAPGLSLDGISNSSMERVVKCLLDMLSQRMRDMSRTEQLTTELRTTRYDLERMTSMKNTAADQAANFEREMNLQKTRLIAVTKNLQSSELAHKHTTAELSRTRTTLQGIRATHHGETKKKEREIERMAEKWSKIADAQSKLSSAASGMKILNGSSVGGSESVGKGKGYVDLALEDSEKARKALAFDNTKLRRLVLDAVNESQDLLWKMRRTGGRTNEPQPVPITTTVLFPLAPPDAASDKIQSITTSMKQLVDEFSNKAPVFSPTTQSPNVEITTSDSTEEVERLQKIIRELNDEIERCKKDVKVYSAQTSAALESVTGDRRIVGSNQADVSVNLMTIPARVEEKEGLNKRKRQPDDGRARITEATIQLAKERTIILVDKEKLESAKQTWRLQEINSPSTPDAVSEPPTNPRKSPSSPFKKSTSKSSKRSPIRQVVVGKAGEGRKANKFEKRSTLLFVPPKDRIVEPSCETEVLPSRTSLVTSFTGASLLPTTFALPPPSPNSFLPSNIDLLLTQKDAESSKVPRSSPSDLESNPIPPSTNTNLGTTSNPNSCAPRPFPMAKPYAPRMIHAYSPAKPSPLSRILMLGNSPELGQPSLESLSELDEGHPEDEMFPEISQPEAVISLAQELGVTESPPDSPARPQSPLMEKRVEHNVMSKSSVKLTEKGRVIHSQKENSRITGQSTFVRPKAVVMEKENSGSRKAVTVNKTRTTESRRVEVTSSAAVKPPILGKGMSGPRRVPVGSSEAARLGPTARR